VNITFVSDSIYPYNKGGKEKRLYELSTRLAAMGHDVHIYTMHWWNTSSKTVIEDGVQLHAISKLHPMYKGDIRSIKEGVLFGLACFRLFRVKFEILDVDHMPFFPIYSAWIVCTLRRKKLYATWHEALTRKDWTDYMGPLGNVAALIERISIRLPYSITAASLHTQNLLSSEFKRTKRVSIVTSGIDTALINSLKPLNKKCDVLYAGRLVKDKNIDKLVDAVAILAKVNPSIRCTIIGHGIEKENIKKQVAKLGLQTQISLLDPLPNASDVYRHMKTTKVFCLPSVREGFGIVALEALGCGAPVVTTNSPANASKDLITASGNGDVVTLTAKSFADAINDWITRMRPTGIAKQVASYDWNKLTLKQAEVYTS
jgi:glycosyltransferase involved in cell wall biosynthesis